MKIKSKELLLKNLGNDDSIPDNPFTSLEKLRKYLRRVNPTTPVFYVDTINILFLINFSVLFLSFL